MVWRCDNILCVMMIWDEAWCFATMCNDCYDVWWCVTTCDDVWWCVLIWRCAMMCDEFWWYVLCDAVRWCAMACDDAWWCVMMCDDVWWCVRLCDVWRCDEAMLIWWSDITMIWCSVNNNVMALRCANAMLRCGNAILFCCYVCMFFSSICGWVDMFHKYYVICDDVMM